MDTLRRHEIFEIEVLKKLKDRQLLLPLVFVGGTMLRLCYDLNRYSTDLDFWFLKKVEQRGYFKKLKDALSGYQITDSKLKFNTILLEVRSKNYPKRLKIEIRRQVKDLDLQERIAFSKFTTLQVALKALTLQGAMKAKIEAGLDRKDIRDFYDMEFLCRQGAEVKAGEKELEKLKEIILSFKAQDYKVALGSLLEEEERKYYVKNGFEYLLSRLS
jgi:predicted nucleotidyltransferase component of viral defense system